MRYVHGLGRLSLGEIDEVGNALINIFDESGMIGVVEKNRVNYLLKDHLGSTRVVVDEVGQKRGGLNYSDFGETTISGEVEDIRYRYTGQEWDEELEEYNYLAREYDPAMARFNSPDPAREGFSPYVYVGNNPINFVDTNGKVKTYVTGSYIGYTESPLNIGKPTLYFTRGHLTQTHSVADNIGWHPIREGKILNCINLTRSESEWFKECSYYQQLMFCMEIIREDSYQEKLDTSNLLEFSSKEGDVFDLHHSRSKLVRRGDPDFNPEYNQNYAEEMIKSAKIAENVNENVNEVTLKYSTSNADDYRDFGMRRGQVLELANSAPGERIGEGARVKLPRIE